MRIAQISDLHFTHLTWNPLRLLSKRILGNLNWLLTRNRAFSMELLSPLPSLLEELDVDLILVGGDLSTTSLDEEFLAAKAFLDRLPAPKLYIPGNHDCYTYQSEKTQAFYRHFQNPNPSLASDRLEVHPLPCGWTLIALDTSRATSLTSSRGLFSLELEQKLELTLASLPEETFVILWNHYPFFENDLPSRSLTRGDALRALIARHPKIRLYLQGHSHRHVVADLRPSGLPVLLDSGCLVHSASGSWNLLELSSESCKVEGYRWNQGWNKAHETHFHWTGSKKDSPFSAPAVENVAPVRPATSFSDPKTSKS